MEKGRYGLLYTILQSSGPGIFVIEYASNLPNTPLPAEHQSRYNPLK